MFAVDSAPNLGRKKSGLPATALIKGDFLAERDEVAAAFALGIFHRFGGRNLKHCQLRLEVGDFGFELEDPLHSCQVETHGGEVEDPPQVFDVGIGVPPATAPGPVGNDQSFAFIDAQCLRVTASQLGSHRDHIQRTGGRTWLGGLARLSWLAWLADVGGVVVHHLPASR